MAETAFGKKEDDKKTTAHKKNTQKKFGNYFFLTADYFDFKTPGELQKKDFTGYTMEIQNSDGTILDKYRTDSLAEREKMTYKKMDSVGIKYKLDQNLKCISRL